MLWQGLISELNSSAVCRQNRAKRFFWRAFEEIEAQPNCSSARFTHVILQTLCEVTAASSRSPFSNAVAMKVGLFWFKHLQKMRALLPWRWTGPPSRTQFGLPCGDRLLTTRNSRNLSFLGTCIALLGEMGTRMRRRPSGCKSWWMRFA
jgi:hypothetical protein